MAVVSSSTGDGSRRSGMRIGLVGMGQWGRHWARVLAGAGLLGCVVDPDPLEEAVHNLPADVRIYLSLNEVLEGNDAFVVASPAATHHDVACELLRWDHHVLVEKPIALSVWQAEQMVKTAEERRKVLMVGHILEHHPAFLKLEHLIREGEVGEIRHISSRRMSFGRIRDDEDVIWSFAPHDIAMIQRLMGEAPMRVEASAIHTLRRDLADAANIIMRFSHGRTAAIEVSWHSFVKEHRLVVTGSKGSLCWNDVDKSLRSEHYQVSDGELKRIHYRHQIYYGNEEPLANELKAFVEAIENGSAKHCDGRSGLRVIETLERIS
jgi:UDP-2-acetamido-3-amino-2,3-dideoxy-glucuronate N-acetyltransferase